MNDYHSNETCFWIVLSHQPNDLLYLYLYLSISYLSEYLFTCFRFEGIFDFVEWFLVHLARSKTWRRKYDTQIPSRTQKKANRIPIRQIDKQFQCHACVRTYVCVFMYVCMYVCLLTVLIINSLHRTNFISMNVIDFLCCINDFWSDEVKLICVATIFLFWYCYLSVEAVRFTNLKFASILSLFVQI